MPGLMGTVLQACYMLGVIAFLPPIEGLWTDAEALAYLMPASLETPMDRDWIKIYLYISTRVCSSAGKEVPEDIRVETLSDYLMQELNRLKAWIYQQRIKVRLERDRAERRQRKNDEAARRKAEQPARFDF